MIAALPARGGAAAGRCGSIAPSTREPSSCPSRPARSGCTSAARPSTARAHRQRAAVRRRCGCERWLRERGYDVTLVHNITDVNDKIYEAAPGRERRAGGARRRDWYLEDTERLRARTSPTTEPRATETMAEIVAFIEELIERELRVRGRRRRLLPRRAASRVRAALGPAARPGRGAGAEPAEGGSARLRALEGEQAGRGHMVGLAVGPRPAGLAHRVLGDGREAARRRRSRSTAAASTSSSRTTRTSSRSRARSGTSSRGSGCTTACSASPARRCRSRSGTSSTIREVLDRWGRETRCCSSSTAHWRKPIDFSDETMAQAQAAGRELPRGLPRRRRSAPRTAPGSGSRRRSTTTSTRPRRSRVMHEWRATSELLRRGARGLRARVARRAGRGAGGGASRSRRARRRRARPKRLREADRLRAEIEAARLGGARRAGGFRLVPKP